jgi:hypothetical protein
VIASRKEEDPTAITMLLAQDLKIVSKSQTENFAATAQTKFFFEMFALVHVFENRFLSCESLSEVEYLLNISGVNKTLSDHMTQTFKNQYIVSLMEKIRSKHFSTPLTHVGLSAAERAKIFLADLDYLGKKLQMLILPGSIIAGSYPLSWLLFLDTGDLRFKSNDVDLYISQDCEKDTEKAFIHNFQKWSWQTLHEEEEYNSTTDRFLHDDDKLDTLKMCFSQYDWDRILPSTFFGNRRLPNTHIDKVSMVKVDTDFVLAEKRVNCILLENVFVDKGKLAKDVCSRFDMHQCRVAITSISGTFYPHLFYDQQTKLCVDARSIVFNTTAFPDSVHKQMTRAFKYIERGFFLPEKQVDSFVNVL